MNLRELFNAKDILVEEQQWYNLTHLSILLRWDIMYIIYIFRTIVPIFVAKFITTFRPLYAPAFFRWFECPQGHMVQWIKAVVRSSDIPKRVGVLYPVKAEENFQKGN